MKLLLLLAVLCGTPGFVKSQIKVFIVRHADRAGNADDLTPAGVARAEELKHVLGLAKVQRIFSTNTIRTTKTAQPLATLMGLPVNIYATAPAVAALIKGNPAIKANFIVGHSDTVDDLIKACGCTPPPAITPAMPTTQYDNLFVLVLRKPCVGKVYTCELTHLRYSAITP
ncbi:MAG: histidine phosphatase family protein [Chitinophagaceae bacterium]